MRKTSTPCRLSRDFSVVTGNDVPEFSRLIQKERESGGKIVYFRRLVLQRAAEEWLARHPEAQK